MAIFQQDYVFKFFTRKKIKQWKDIIIYLITLNLKFIQLFEYCFL